ncbi:MAG: cytochrome c [Candidatus Eremiobacteraeota bacterium]|nr:cytochrome c [Candidatus Eremiobacteraeota bacterium]
MNRISKAGLVGLALILTIAACAKSSDSSSTTTTTSADSAAAGASPGADTNKMNGASAGDGAKIYQTNCSSCHQPTGAGIEGTFPPLAGNPVVTGDSSKVIHILKYGLNGKIEVKGQKYNGMMPAWGTQLSNADIASAITYIRSAWGNKAPAVTEAQVKAVAK